MNLLPQAHMVFDERPPAEELLRHPEDRHFPMADMWAIWIPSSHLATDRQYQYPTFHLHHQADLFLHLNIIPTIAPRSICVQAAWDNGVRQNADTASRCCGKGV